MGSTEDDSTGRHRGGTTHAEDDATNGGGVGVRRWRGPVPSRNEGKPGREPPAARGEHPDPDVIDTVLADRIRSSIGPLEKRLDIPHVHVMVEDHVALLHGEVGDAVDAEEIERAVAAVSGVRSVESYLHVGLGRGNTRPSEGHAAEQPSAARNRLIAAAVDAGAPAEGAPRVVRAVLAALAERLPDGERHQVATHLPEDVRAMFAPPRRFAGEGMTPPKTVEQFVARVVSTTDALPADRAEPVIAAVFETLRSLVPEEAADVAAVLPRDLKSLWEHAGASS